jgi:16S rRNA (uracil1498-N3)-methyltransferase
MDLILQKATELGVARIVPVLTERTVVKVDAKQRERKLEHWQAVVVSACEQCGRNRVPEVAAPTALVDALPALPADAVRCLLAADGDEPLAHAGKGNTSLALLIGPEGGLAGDERQFARTHGFGSYRIGPRILRTETAGLAAIATLQATAGDFS